MLSLPRLPLLLFALAGLAAGPPALAQSFAQLGQDLDGEAANDQSGRSVSLSGDRVAIGAYLNDANGSNSGRTRVYTYDAGTDAWTQLGQDLDGEAADDFSGWSVSLSGDRIAIGAPLNDGNGTPPAIRGCTPTTP